MQAYHWPKKPCYLLSVVHTWINIRKWKKLAQILIPQGNAAQRQNNVELAHMNWSDGSTCHRKYWNCPLICILALALQRVIAGTTGVWLQGRNWIGPLAIHPGSWLSSCNLWETVHRGEYVKLKVYLCVWWHRILLKISLEWDTDEETETDWLLLYFFLYYMAIKMHDRSALSRWSPHSCNQMQAPKKWWKLLKSKQTWPRPDHAPHYPSPCTQK